MLRRLIYKGPTGFKFGGLRFRVFGCFVFEIRVLRFRVLGDSFSKFGCLVLRSSFSSASFSKLPYKFGSIFCDRITANPFSSAHAGTLPKPSNYLRTRRVLLVMPRYLESTGFSGNGLPFGKHLTSLS